MAKRQKKKSVRVIPKVADMQPGPLALAVYNISAAIRDQTSRTWSHEQINSAIIGHLLVAWPMLLSAVAFFIMPRYLTEPAAFGVVFGAVAMLCGWLVNVSATWRTPAIVCTVLSWSCVLLMAALRGAF